MTAARSGDEEEAGETGAGQAQVRMRAVYQSSRSERAAAMDIDAQDRASHGVEARGEDDLSNGYSAAEVRIRPA